jgi:hypothetical protein
MKCRQLFSEWFADKKKRTQLLGGRRDLVSPRWITRRVAPVEKFFPSEKSEAMFSAQDAQTSVTDSLPLCNLASDGAATAKNWFAVFVTPRHEKRVDEHCRVRGIESFLPLFQTQSHWKDGSRRMLQLPLFPTYIFVRIGCGERVSVLQVPGIKFIVGAGRQLLPVPDVECDGRSGDRGYRAFGSRLRLSFIQIAAHT